MGRKKKIVDDEIVEETEDSGLIERELQFVSSGSTNLNLALTNSLENGYPVGKIVNLVGDKQIGKSLLCLEAMMYVYHVLRKKYDVKMIYNDAESAINLENAKQIGVPTDAIEWRQSPTVEHWYEDVNKEIKSSDNYDLVIYIMDSLDGLSTEEELEQEFNQKSYNMIKQKKLGELFRRLTQKINKKNMLLIIVSQIRDAIGVTFGETKRRSGGKALDFYAYQIVWLYNKGLAKDGDITTGIEIKANVKKNRVWKPFRIANFNILFEYGIDDLGSMVDYLIDKKFYLKSGNGKITYGENTYSRENFIQFISSNNKEQEVKDAMKTVWDKLEADAKVIRKPKYAESDDFSDKSNHSNIYG